MKTLINRSRYILLVLFLFNFSCKERKFLEEVPLDFYSPENSYVTISQFESALTDLYAKVREYHYGGNDVKYFAYMISTDIVKSARGNSANFGDYDVYMVPTNSMVQYVWISWYKLIANANTIISRVENSKLTDEEKKEVDAEAKFFRAFAYRYLVYLYGGVPLITEEVTSPKTDNVRATKTEVLEQMAKDFADAANNLPPIAKVKDGKVSNLVASHYLAETYISLENYDKAIAAATFVIDDANVGLMTNRFGSSATKNPTDNFLNFTAPGDVFWDLFRPNNQNRKSGNKEALWVIQMELNIEGGYISTTSPVYHQLERWAGPVAFLTFKDPNGKEGMINKPRSNYNSGGRGTAFMMNTNFFLNTLWESDFNNDIRNSEHNIVRDVIYDNPSSAYYGKSAVKYPSPTKIAQDWRWYPYPTKITTPGEHPDDLFEDKGKLILKSTAGTTYLDQYMLRLAETYLLRAEAYLDKGDKTNSAKDINVVRGRAKANPVSASNVTLDYILDERARELVYEEQRRLTLMRTNKLVERVRLYNDFNSDEIKDFHNLWPIPYSEIEANKDAVIEQNPGYN